MVVNPITADHIVLIYLVQVCFNSGIGLWVGSQTKRRRRLEPDTSVPVRDHRRRKVLNIGDWGGGRFG